MTANNRKKDEVSKKCWVSDGNADLDCWHGHTALWNNPFATNNRFLKHVNGICFRLDITYFHFNFLSLSNLL